MGSSSGSSKGGGGPAGAAAKNTGRVIPGFVYTPSAEVLDREGHPQGPTPHIIDLAEQEKQRRFGTLSAADHRATGIARDAHHARVDELRKALSTAEKNRRALEKGGPAKSEWMRREIAGLKAIEEVAREAWKDANETPSPGGIQFNM